MNRSILHLSIISILLLTGGNFIFSQDGNIKGLGDIINSSGSELYPSLSTDGATLVFSSRREGDSSSNIYISRATGGTWEETEALDVINSDSDDVSPYLSFDGSMIVFASNRPYSSGGSEGEVKKQFDLYISFNIENRWSKPYRLSDEVNTAGIEYAPSFSNDNKTLYFTRWPDGARDASKIYSAKLSDNGYGNVKVLPPRINRGHFEIAFYPSRTKSGFFFASRRPGGFGSMDIYYVLFESGKFTEPVNIGPTINSESDEISIAEIRSSIYFCSNRSGGLGSYDIYSGDMPPNLPDASALVIKDKKQPKIDPEKIIEKVVEKEKDTDFNLKIVEEGSKKPLSINLEIILLSEGQIESEGKKIAENSGKSGEIELSLAPQISALIIKSGDSKITSFSSRFTVEKGKLNEKTIRVKPAKKTIVKYDPLDLTNFKPVYFNYNSSKLKLRYIPYLYSIISYMRENHDARLKITGHSGRIGRPWRNERLSLRRAKSVRDYLVSFGIDRDRIKVEGLGDRFPADMKFNEINRRVEIKVLK